MRYRYALIALALASMPAMVSAKSQTVWSFLGGQVGPEWRVQGTATTTAEVGGLRIRPETDTKIFREAALPHSADYIEVTYLSLTDNQAILLWHNPGDPAEEIIQLPFLMPRTTVAKTVKLDVGWFDQWVGRPDVVGISLPKGSDVQLMQIAFVRLNPFEKAGALLKSYWTFDRLTPYSINFLWGPIFTPSPVARETLYQILPPHGTYANQVWYVLLLLSATVCVVLQWKPKYRRKALAALGGLFAAVWILSDLRMGTEAMRYALHDIQEYWRKPAAERSFRERADFPVFMKQVQPLVEDRGRYIFLTQYAYPLLGLMRYHTYPSEPVAPETAGEGVDTWVIYERPEISINEEGRLVSEGQPISAPGEILYVMRPGAFVFRTR
ncbi:MAG: hypothetical protein AAB544_00660 [Patescibacteria group bacterium]